MYIVIDQESSDVIVEDDASSGSEGEPDTAIAQLRAKKQRLQREMASQVCGVLDDGQSGV